MAELNGCERSLLSNRKTYDLLFVATHVSTIWLHSCQQLTIAIELIFPVAVDGSQPARRTTESEIQPSHILAFIVQRDSNGHLECFIPARTATFAEVGLFEILVAIADWMFEFTRCTFSAGSTFVVVKKDFEKTTSAFADRIRKVLRDVAVFQAVRAGSRRGCLPDYHRIGVFRVSSTTLPRLHRRTADSRNDIQGDYRKNGPRQSPDAIAVAGVSRGANWPRNSWASQCPASFCAVKVDTVSSLVS